MEQGHLLSILWDSGPVIKLTLLVLICFSVSTWAIIFYKYQEITRLKKNSERFFETFWRATNLEELATKQAGQENPLFNVFRVAMSELMRRGKNGETRKVTPQGIRRRIEQAIDHEVEKVERYIPFLATTGSTAPFIGLFGTVWGILEAFWKIGKAGSSSLAVVGPYIAEALIATAVGLAAAIPAVIFYNFFVTRIKTFTKDLQSFGEDLDQRIDSDYFRL